MLPSDKVLVRAVSMRLAHRHGLEAALRDLADPIEEEYRRRDRFDKITNGDAFRVSTVRQSLRPVTAAGHSRDIFGMPMRDAGNA